MKSNAQLWRYLPSGSSKRIAKNVFKELLNYFILKYISAMDNRTTSSTLTETQTRHVPLGTAADEALNLRPTFKGAVVKSLFVLGSAMLIFESVRNSLTWYLARFWGGAGDVWQMLWESFLVRR